MKGFTFKIGENEISAALEAGSIGIIVSNKDGDYNISLDVMDAQGLYYNWYNDKLCTGESISIKYENLDEQMVSTPILIRDVNDEESENKLLLDSYYRLKQELLDEGLLSE